MKFIRYLLVSLFLMLPAFASADTIIKPPGHDTWEMHVMGNGPVIASVLESVKLVIAPEHGGSGFRSLLLFIALLGFCILAVQAGFNPGANLFKMFGYLFVVWVVTLTTTQLKANVMVLDPVTRKDTFVAKVPAIVALPAAVVSGIGHYLTSSIEMAYSTPGQQLSLTGAGFDIFGKIQSDLDQYTIVQPELQKSMAAYVADCTVPAIAKQRLTATELYTSNDLMSTLAKAMSGTTLTRYYEPDATSAAASTSFGVTSDVITCKDAYSKLATAMEEHAKQMVDASTSEWTKSGVMVPFESVLQTFVEQANAGIGAGGGSYGRPTGMITQKALINTMGGDFRQAAVQSGNNELLMGLQISQAEQSQKSGWVTSAAVFKNMMGYVYTTLQAFIYAITPVVVIALMVPGLGRKIFVNYGQVLIWLTLWEPMLSIVNYLVTLFRMEGVANAVAGSGGITMLNTWTTSEAANNMVIAASFLGTMVPVLAWGLVTGAMAFNDFISHGIGSSFAMQAGAAAATGSVGLNTASMNSLNSNKFDNAQKSTVGSQSVMAHETAGALTASVDHGGRTESANSSAISVQGQLGQGNVHSDTVGKQTSNSLSAGTSSQAGSDARSTQDTSKKVDSSVANSKEHSESSGKNAAESHSTGKDVSKSNSVKNSDTSGVQEAHQVTAQLSSGAEISAKPGKKPGAAGAAAGAAGAAGGAVQGGAGVKAGANVMDSQTTTNSSAKNLTNESGVSSSEKAGSSTSTGTSAAVNDGASTRASVSSTTANSSGTSKSSSVGTGVNAGKSTSVSSSAGSSAAHNVSDTLTKSATLDTTSEDIARVRDGASGAGQHDFGMDKAAYDIAHQSSAEMQQVKEAFGSASHALHGAGGPAAISMPSVPGSGPDLSLLHSAETKITDTTAGLERGASSMTAGVSSAMTSGLNSSSSLFGDMSGLQQGAGGSPFALASGGADGKMMALGIGAAGTAVTAIAGNSVTQALMSRGGAAAAGAAVAGEGAAATGGGALAAGGMTAGGLAVGALGVGAAFAGGWYVGGKINEYVGEENMAKFLEPVFKGIDSGIDVFQKNTPAWVTGGK